MKANDIFNSGRFGKYFVSDLRTCANNYGLSLLTISLLSPLALAVIVPAVSFFVGEGWDGPGLMLRLVTFCIMMFCLIVTMPVKCYGRITEKQYGSFWLTLPASRLEKFISMILICCIIIPFSGLALYAGMDFLLCSIDSTCGHSLTEAAGRFFKGVADFGNNLTRNMGTEHIDVNDAALAAELMQKISSPWLYFDELLGASLPFLLGAICFKEGKTVKTILAIAVFSTAVSIITTPLMTSYIPGLIGGAASEEEAVRSMLNSGLFSNLVLIDTISDGIVYLALMTAIYFRIKTLKH